MSQWRYAFSLSKQQVADATPPGTTRLVEHENHHHIALIPPPTLSPKDPLNWPRWRKWSLLLIMSMYCGSANIAAASTAPALTILMAQLPQAWHRPPPKFSNLTHLVAVNVLMIGLSNIIWVPLANTFGRRPILITAMAIGVAATLWCAEAESFSSLLAARAIQGFGLGPADTIAASIVGEVFFVHERGRAMAVYTLFLAGGSFVGGLAGGYIAALQGYKYIFWISLALLAFCLVCEILLVPETSFDREAQLLRDHEYNSGEGAMGKEKNSIDMIEQASASPSYHDGPFTFGQSLKVGIYRGNLLRNFLAPWYSLAFPGTWVVMLHYGGLLGALVTISTVGPQFLAMPPYLWGNNVGLVNLGGLIGALAGGVLTFLMADFATKRHARKQSHGLAEPESRLPVMFPALFLATTGIWTFGFCAANPSVHAWVGMCVGLGMVGAGITQIPSVGFNYLIDAYHVVAADCFVMTTIMRAVVGFAWTFFVSDWVARDGAALPFGIFGMLMALFSLLTIPLWLFGKRLRIATAALLPKIEE
ncbi:hypothetical protein AC578_8866 [Pseudocercospora eumusae]|uniref:Major facilitator superfamily (MFS) profile domain-containing protein n=1 Tax=Pseudocercospora eumusae TaxID=321146 RepID=A0A139HBR7_9PEZI|nr:hypothetical protein AC578_8866 [Pseudocercospora eumusae]